MKIIDITSKVRRTICFSFLAIVSVSIIGGYISFKYWHRDETIKIANAKVTGTMVSTRVLTNGKVKEILFEDGTVVEEGDVIARLNVDISKEEIEQLKNTVQLAKENYSRLQEGQFVRIPVQRERIVKPATPGYTLGSGGASENLSKLAERAERMEELFDMGAVSAVERDAARNAYENARAESSAVQYIPPSAPVVEYYTEYIEQFQPTPPEILEGAAQAIEQAELSLNIAQQEARETEILAPIDGTIYYNVEVEKELKAGESVAKIGNIQELWLEAEITEKDFNKIPLGKLVSFSFEGRNLFGTVIEKISPTESKNPIDVLPSTTISEKSELDVSETPEISESTQNSEIEKDSLTSQISETSQEELASEIEEMASELMPPNKNDKFIVRFSLPKDFDFKPNAITTVQINL